jgi:hypothetical protein
VSTLGNAMTLPTRMMSPYMTSFHAEGTMQASMEGELRFAGQLHSLDRSFGEVSSKSPKQFA